MKISELIGLLQAMQEEHGDLEVEGLDINGYRRPINPPRLAYKMILTGKQWKDSFWYGGYSVERRGDLVCRLD